jgi:hypothetical protein
MGMGIGLAWNRTCKTVFGREIGGLPDYAQYLSEVQNSTSAKSCVSRKRLLLQSSEYCKGARFYEYGTEAASVKPQPLHIDEIKDTDSLIYALGERLIYSGNKVLGNSADISGSDNVLDSACVLDSYGLNMCKNVAYTGLARMSENLFGCSDLGDECNMVIRGFYARAFTRCFECAYMGSSSDCYYCYNCIGSSDCLFCFNRYNCRNTIGNIPLEKSKYAELKKKLVGEIADELEKTRRMRFSIVDITRVEL